jgi:hypothetical protein
MLVNYLLLLINVVVKEEAQMLEQGGKAFSTGIVETREVSGLTGGFHNAAVLSNVRLRKAPSYVRVRKVGSNRER